MPYNVTVYTDGASSPRSKHQIGGWAFVFFIDESKSRYENSGYGIGVTNNMMELTAIITAMNSINLMYQYYVNEKLNVKIISDSQYCVNGCSDWVNKWSRTNWKNNTVKNRDLWEAFLMERDKHDDVNFEFEWVRGHDGNEHNEYVDKLCVEAKHRGIEEYNAQTA